jgi:tetratricopeptide (TPR) repeat protein
LGQDHPAALGWRIFLKMVQRVECAVPATPAFAGQVEDLMQEALRRDPTNAIVLSASAHACIKVLDRPEDALILAQRALRQSWSNPFALDVVADALLLQGRAEDAYPIAKRAQLVGQSTPMSHFFDMGLALACVAVGRTDEALSLAQQAAALAPSFRPALRYAVILNANKGRHEEALRALRRLRAIEPAFDLAQMVGDPDYPVATIRNAGLAGPRIAKLLQ